MLGTHFNNRYQLISELGRGGMSVVYRAHDTLLERDVAVKLLSSATLGEEGRFRLMHEAKSAARLNHPNIIQVYDAGVADSQAFIIMQLLEGKSLYIFKPSSLDEVLSITRQICQALDHAHAHGVIHRDLKPENVILTAGGVVTLTDFGLARSVVSRVSVEGAIVGTVLYLSPEQALGQPVDGRTDLYSLGVMLYELACGRLPFVAEDPLAVIAQHLYAPLVPPSTYNPRIPALLDTLIGKLLSKRPEDRPSSASEVLAILDMFPTETDRVPQAAPGIPGSPPPLQQIIEESAAGELSPLDRLARGRLMGRDRELAQTRTMWKQVLLGNSQVLLISGEPGVGKTPLVRAIIALAQVSGGRALVGECFPEGSAPYAPIVQFIRSAMEEGNLSLPNPVLVDLLALAPELRDRFPELPSHLPPTDPLEQGRLFDSVFALCASLAAQAPLLLVVEDVQWADRGTLYLLRSLARRARAVGLRMFVVLTYRETELTEAHELNIVLLDLNRERLAERIKLSRFNREQTGEILAMMFQEEISPEFLDAIYCETEGNLFFVEEMCKALIEEGKLYRENGHWRWKSLQEIELPQSVRMTIQARIARLPITAQETLRLASIFGREFDFDTLAKASEQDEDTLVNALELAERAQLIAEAQPKRPSRSRAGQVLFAFEHALIPATLRESMTSLRRHRLHQRAAAAIEALHPGDHAALAYHYGQAGDAECARKHYRLAGDQARSVDANQDAIFFYTEALSLYEPEDSEQFDVLAARERVYDLTAQREAQLGDARLMLEIAERVNNDNWRCDALLALSDVYLRTDHPLAKEPAGRAAAIAQAMGDPVREGQALRRMGEEAWRSTDYANSRRMLEEATQRFKEAGATGEAAACLHMLSLVLGFQGMGIIHDAQIAAEQALALSRQAGDRRQEATSLRRLAIVYTDQFRHAEALPFAQQALTLHQEIGDRGETERALNVLGLIMGWLGRDAEAEDFLRQSLEIAESASSVEGISNAAINLCWISFEKRGECEAGLNFLEALLGRMHRLESALLTSTLLGRKVEMLINLGQFERARAVLDDIISGAYTQLSSSQQAQVHAAYGLLLAELGDFPGYRQRLESALELARQVERPLDSAVVLTIYAAANLLEGTPDSLREGLAHADDALALLAGTNWKFNLGDALILSAELHLDLGEMKQALAHSEEAVRLVAGFPIPHQRYDFIYSRALRAAGRQPEADHRLRQAYERVVQIAQNFQDPALRQSWLNNVRTNRQILSEAASIGFK